MGSTATSVYCYKVNIEIFDLSSGTYQTQQYNQGSEHNILLLRQAHPEHYWATKINQEQQEQPKQQEQQRQHVMANEYRELSPNHLYLQSV